MLYFIYSINNEDYGGYTFAGTETLGRFFGVLLDDLLGQGLNGRVGTC